MDRYIILDVDYDKRTDYGRSLGWVAPALKDAPGLTMTEDDNESEGGNVYCGRCERSMPWLDMDDEPCIDDDGHERVIVHRKWAGIIDGETWDRLVNDWSLDESDSENNMGMLTEYGHLASLAFNFDGMDWNMGGETPILYASLYVSIPVE